MIWCFSCNIAMQERNPVICLAEPVLPTATSSTCLVSYLPVPSSRQAGIRKFFCAFQAGFRMFFCAFQAGFRILNPTCQSELRGEKLSWQ